MRTIKMSKREFIKAFRAEIDLYIRNQAGNVRLNDAERELWILNDEYLYTWARQYRVNI